MALAKVTLNHAEIARILKEDCRPMVDAAAEKIADNARDAGITVGDKDGGASEYDLPITVRSYTSDRAVAVVALAHPAGLSVEAKHGILRRAAASIGLELRSKP